MKRFIALLLAFVLVVGLAPTVTLAAGPKLEVETLTAYETKNTTPDALATNAGAIQPFGTGPSGIFTFMAWESSTSTVLRNAKVTISVDDVVTFESLTHQGAAWNFTLPSMSSQVTVSVSLPVGYEVNLTDVWDIRQDGSPFPVSPPPSEDGTVTFLASQLGPLFGENIRLNISWILNKTTGNGPNPTYGIGLNPTNHVFDSAVEGYGQQPARTVTVTNTGNQPTGNLAVTSNSSAFTLSTGSIPSIATGGTGTFTVRPNTGLAPGVHTGTVTVANAANNISETMTVSFTVEPEPTTPAHSIRLNPTRHTFISAIAGYGEQAAQTVTVTNTGNQPTGNLNITLGNNSPFVLGSSTIPSIAAGGAGTFTIQPNTGLVPGTYIETVTVSNATNNISETMTVTFTVEPEEEEPIEPEPPELPFTDVAEGRWYHPAVAFVHENGIMQGTSGNTFAPNMDFSRAMVVTTLFRMYHDRVAGDDDDPTATPFDDVGEGRWYAPYIAWAHENGIVQGVSDTRFAPQRAVSRQEFATMMYRFAEFLEMDTDVSDDPLAEFADADDVQGWAEDAKVWAVYSGLITGTNRGLEPRGTASRAQAATILMRFVPMLD